MIAEEANGVNEHSAVAFGFEAQNCFFHGGADPRAPGHALALEGEGPGVRCEAGGFRYQLGGFFGLGFVGIAFGDGARGNAVGGEDDGQRARQRSAVFGVCFFPSSAQVFCERFG